MSCKIVLALLSCWLLLTSGCGGQSNTATSRSHVGSTANEGGEGPKHPSKSRPAPAHSYRVALRGNDLVTRANPSGSSAALLTLRPGARQLCWRFGPLPGVVLHTAAFGRVQTSFGPTAAYIHVGAKGFDGPIVAVLGSRFRSRGCAGISPVVLNSIASAPRSYYLSVATTRSPRGAARGQL